MKDFNDFTSAEMAEFVAGRSHIMDNFDEVEDIIEDFVDRAFEQNAAETDIAAMVRVSPEYITDYIIDKVDFYDDGDSDFVMRGKCVGWAIRVEDHFEYHFGGSE